MKDTGLGQITEISSHYPLRAHPHVYRLRKYVERIARPKDSDLI